ADTVEADFVQKRETRDKTLAVPRLIYPSVQVNIRAGQLPQAESNGMSYVKIPLKQV
ncbi:MAG: MBL fold metallo-hydrolase, partial [Alishewanella sp.]|nr:MBL fold metallo-hydrolase [Alishewanella sp.]